MAEYQSNSHKSKEEVATTGEKRVKKVVSGNVRTKKNEGRRLMNLFVSEDADRKSVV